MPATSIGTIRRLPVRVLRFARRQAVEWSLSVRYRAQNLITERAVNDPRSNVMVSLTTHGARLRTVYQAIESISAGTQRPLAIILWVDEDAFATAQKVASLRRLIDRGLEVRPASAALGSHKKYFHVIEDPRAELFPVITADDDIFYPSRWLERLAQAYAQSDGRTVFSSWVKTIGMNDVGFARYESWSTVYHTARHELNYFMSGSGTIFPPGFAVFLREKGTTFLSCAPKADDVWLNAQATLAGYSVRQVQPEPLKIWSVPLSQRIKLSTLNVTQSLNDVQLAATYSPEQIARLKRITRSPRE